VGSVDVLACECMCVNRYLHTLSHSHKHEHTHTNFRPFIFLFVFVAGALQEAGTPLYSRSSPYGVLHRAASCCSVLQRVAPKRVALRSVYALPHEVCRSVLQCVAVSCSALQCVTAQCVVVYYAVLQCGSVLFCSVLRCVAVCCSVLQWAS